jgi:pSer/pThr/pTyr-binding forkhead associated (FHA) protein
MAHLKSLDEKILIRLVENVPLQIGRSPRCEVPIDDLSISSIHARLSLRNNMLKLTDLESTNGTRVNYAAIRDPRYLMDGDVVEFGSLTFVVYGHELREPNQDEVNAQSMRDIPVQTTLEAVEDTLRDIQVPEEELAAVNGAGDPGESSGPAPSVRGNPAGFALAMLFLVLGGALLLAYLWTRTPSL